jgi:hypothetical protein
MISSSDGKLTRAKEACSRNRAPAPLPQRGGETIADLNASLVELEGRQEAVAKEIEVTTPAPVNGRIDRLRELRGSDPEALGLKVYGNNVSVTINGQEMSWATAVRGSHLQFG